MGTELTADRPVLCMVTDRHRLAAHVRSRRSPLELVVAHVAAAARAGVHMVQLRERDLCSSTLADLARQCLVAARGTPTKIVINDRLDVALATGAHGVHLREDSFPASRARTLVPTGFLIGQSVHDPEHSCLCGAVADYVIVGTVFRSRSKDVRPTGGPERVAEVVGKSSVPVLAIGGISVDTLALLRGTGAAGFAAIDFFLGPEGTEDE
ncbi:MAG: thiamine phosphate synthase, partial [Acidobacteria bacterium]|nr:thiamine phosphate synthase [Acidobacteriota bacterium]